jgi:DnaJ family protein C protein 3
MRHPYIFVFLLGLLLPYTVFGEKSVQQYLSEGSNYLISGQFNDALVSFEAAIRKFLFTIKKSNKETLTHTHIYICR